VCYKREFSRLLRLIASVDFSRHLSLNLLFESKKLVGGIDEMRSEFDGNARFMSTSKIGEDLKGTGKFQFEKTG
jgi:hypothetical protein